MIDKNILRHAALAHPEALTMPYDAIMRDAGFDSVFAFAEYFGGTTIYVPHPKSIFARCIELEIIKEYRGGNYAEIARKYGYTERHVRRIVQAG